LKGLLGGATSGEEPAHNRVHDDGRWQQLLQASCKKCSNAKSTTYEYTCIVRTKWYVHVYYTYVYSFIYI
jgi:hypothetical protein